MSSQVTLQPSGHCFPVETGETILEAALRHGLNLPYSCKNGACGACKGTLVSGEVSHRPHQDKALTAAEAAAGKALLCCAETQGDVTVNVREVSAAGDIQVKTLPCRVESIDKVKDVAVIKLKIPAAERLQFLAGQYIDILMRDGKARSFSLANAPHDDQLLELHIRHMPGGTFSDYVFNTMKVKEILRFKGPLGTFFLRDDSDKPIVFLASGTGFAPVKAIVEHALASGNRRQMVLYWGARKLDDIYMPELPAKWQAEYDNFTFIPVLSDPLPEDNWPGRTGLVHEAVLADFEDMSGYQVYACGAPAMVEVAHGAFTRERGLPEDEFFSDAFFLSKDTTPAAK